MKTLSSPLAVIFILFLFAVLWLIKTPNDFIHFLIDPLDRWLSKKIDEAFEGLW